MKKLKLSLILFLLLGIGYDSLAREGSSGVFVVREIKAADRIILTNGKTVRLVGIEAMESRPSERAKQQAAKWNISTEKVNILGTFANAYVKNFIKGKPVLIEFDLKKENKNGQWNGYLFFKAPKDTVDSDFAKGVIVEKGKGQKYIFLNALLLDQGYASLGIFPSGSMYEQFFYQLNSKQDKEDALLGRGN